MKNRNAPNGQPISAVVTDVDGTLVTKDKVLTPRALQSVKSLRDRGLTVIEYENSAPNKELARIQSTEGIMERHNGLNELGRFIKSAIK